MQGVIRLNRWTYTSYLLFFYILPCFLDTVYEGSDQIKQMDFYAKCLLDLKRFLTTKKYNAMYESRLNNYQQAL